MKKILVYFLSILLTTASYSQKLHPAQPLLKEDYLLKSKNQKKVGWILLGGGTGLILTSALIPRGELVRDGICWGLFLCEEEYKNDGIRGIIVVAGGLSILSSIPFFIASGKNKRKAYRTVLNVSPYFRLEKAPVLNTYNIGIDRIPSIGVRFNY
jgi:hypothetical protein